MARLGKSVLIRCNFNTCHTSYKFLKLETHLELTLGGKMKKWQKSSHKFKHQSVQYYLIQVLCKEIPFLPTLFNSFCEAIKNCEKNSYFCFQALKTLINKKMDKNNLRQTKKNMTIISDLGFMLDKHIDTNYSFGINNTIKVPWPDIDLLIEIFEKWSPVNVVIHILTPPMSKKSWRAWCHLWTNLRRSEH